MPKIINFTQAASRLVQPPTHREPPRINPARLWIERRKPGRSRDTAKHYLNVAARLLGHGGGSLDDWEQCSWWQLGYEDVMLLRARLVDAVEADEYVPGSANGILAAVKGVMAEVWRLGVGRAEKWLDAEGLEVIRQVERVPGKRMRRERRTLTDEEIARLLRHCTADMTPRGQRDAALVALATMCGLRASEYAALQIDDYDREGRRIRIPQIKVQVSDQDVWLPLESPATDYIDRWLARRGPRSGPLFTRMERGGLGVSQDLEAQSIRYIMAVRGEECGIAGVTPHAMRRAFVTRVLTHTGDLAMASKLARHTSPTTTATYYDRRGDAEMRDTLRRVPWPGQGLERGE